MGVPIPKFVKQIYWRFKEKFQADPRRLETLKKLDLIAVGFAKRLEKGDIKSAFRILENQLGEPAAAFLHIYELRVAAAKNDGEGMLEALAKNLEQAGAHEEARFLRNRRISPEERLKKVAERAEQIRKQLKKIPEYSEIFQEHISYEVESFQRAGHIGFSVLTISYISGIFYASFAKLQSVTSGRIVKSTEELNRILEGKLAEADPTGGVVIALTLITVAVV
ncbi:TPA: hypothetical protein H1005_00995 [archaeon]|nr:hypothetical protein [Candidatus Naiadarchaeales archaeon SRR2090153.bin1042]